MTAQEWLVNASQALAARATLWAYSPLVLHEDVIAPDGCASSVLLTSLG